MNSFDNTDTELLLERAQKGGSSAFDTLIERFFPFVQRIIRPLASRPSEVDDLVQETFITVFLRLSQLDHPDHFKGWLATMARRIALMNQRRNSVQLRFMSLDEDSPQITEGLNTAALHRAHYKDQKDEVSAAVNEALTRLPANQRYAVQLHYLEGYNYRETAYLLQVPETAIRGRLERARTELRKELAHMNPATTSPPAASLTPGGTLDAHAQELHLTGDDIQAVRLAVIFAEPEESPLNSICLTHEGYLVSTDRRRLFVYQSPTWQGITDITFPADELRTWADTSPTPSTIQLFLNGPQSELRFVNGVLPLKIIETPFPNWKKVVSTDHVLRVSAPLSTWKNEVEGLINFWEHEAKGTLPENEVPRITISFWPEQKRVTLELSQPQSTAEAPTRSLTVAVPVSTLAGQKTFSLGCNAFYLRDAFRVFQGDEGAHIELCANGPLSPFLVRSMQSPNPFVVTMPMQLPTENSEAQS